MDTILCPPIRFGPNAGKPQSINDVLLSRVSAVRDVLVKVRHAGYRAVSVRIDGARPTITMVAHSDFQRLVDEGVACYYVWQSGPQGLPERWGQFQVDGVRLIWCERGQ